MNLAARIFSNVAILSACFVSAVASAQNGPPLVSRNVQVFYNAVGAPPMVDITRVRTAFEHAAKRWAPCGVEFVFAGETIAEPGKLDGLNVLGWLGTGSRSDTSSSERAGATKRWVRADHTMEFDIVLVRFHTRTARELEFVLVHELGHALGLMHSRHVQSVMYPAAEPIDLYPKLAHEDMEACRLIYAQ